MEYSPEARMALRQIAPEILKHGLDGAAEALRVLLNEVALSEREAYLGAAPYERTETRRDHANGFKPKRLLTRVGEVEVRVPQVRSGEFYPTALEKGTRTERAMHLALAEMYVQGVSTRKVIEVLQKLMGPGFELSSMQVSRATASLDEALGQWRERPLGPTPYLILDARYERVRHEGSVYDVAVLVALGVTQTGHRRVLGTSVALSEAEVHWRTFLESLQARGLTGVQLVVSDDHSGLRAARRAVLPSVPWQRCQVHLQRNAAKHVPRLDDRARVARELAAVFRAATAEDARALLTRTLATWRKAGWTALADWAEVNVPEGLTVLTLPESHRLRLRTTNGLERVNRELKRRTRVATIFPNAASCLRLVSALLAELDEDWQTAKIYINLKST